MDIYTNQIKRLHHVQNVRVVRMHRIKKKLLRKRLEFSEKKREQDKEIQALKREIRKANSKDYLTQDEKAEITKQRQERKQKLDQVKKVSKDLAIGFFSLFEDKPKRRKKKTRG